MKNGQPVDVIARLFDLTPRRVQQLATLGVIPKSENGRYELVSAIRGYIAYLRDRSLGVDTADGDDADHRKRLLRAKADLLEMERDHLAGRLVAVEAVEKCWVDAVTIIRSRLLAMPTKLAPILASAANVGECQRVLDDEIFMALTELSETQVVEEDSTGALAVGEDDEVPTSPNPEDDLDMTDAVA